MHACDAQDLLYTPYVNNTYTRMHVCVCVYVIAIIAIVIIKYTLF